MSYNVVTDTNACLLYASAKYMWVPDITECQIFCSSGTRHDYDIDGA